MSFIKAKEHLKKYGYDNHIITFNVSSATVKDASLALNCEEGMIAKTLSFYTKEKAILIVVEGSCKIDNSKYKKEFNCKAKMIAYDEVESVIGHKSGGVCPFGINDNIDVYLDVSLKKHEYIYPACGSDSSAVKLTINELEKSSNYIKWIDVCKEI